jgi:imidazolonepropionase-like amidohydrolase
VNSPTGPILIESAHCFDGCKLLPERVDVYLEGGRVAWVGSGSAAPGAHRIKAGDRLVMPGLIDTHVHLESPAVPDRTGYVVRTPETLMAFYAAYGARISLEAGFTTLRNMGSHAVVALRQAIERGLIDGPRILAGGYVDMTGGHFDMLRPLLYPRQPEDTADGEASVRQAVRRHVRAGVDFIKIATTGGIVSEGDDSDWITYSNAEIAAICDEAHNLKRHVACHAQGTAGIKRALGADIDTLEHGTFMDAEALQMLIRSKAILMPTLSFFHGVVTRGRALGLPAHWQEKCGPAYEAAKASVRMAREAGARIAFGTDSAGRQAPHGENAGELALLVDLGYTPEQALIAATSDAAAAIGLSDETGRIAPGLSADVLIVNGDPLTDIAVLQDKARIEQIILRGRVMMDRTA